MPNGTTFPVGDYRLQARAFNLLTQRTTVVPFVAHDCLSLILYSLSGKLGRVRVVA